MIRSAFETNARGTLNVLEAARRRPDPPLVFASTDRAYGEPFDPEGWSRSSNDIIPHPVRRAQSTRAARSAVQPLRRSKGAADQYVLDYARVFRLRTVVFRMSCLYGPRQFGTEDQAGWHAF